MKPTLPPHQLRLVEVPGVGRVAVLDHQVPEDAPHAVREGFARRAIANSGGTCPCGARLTPPPRAERRAARRRHEPLHVYIRHEDDCPATDVNLAAAIRTWKETP